MLSKTYYDHDAEMELIVTAYRRPDVFADLADLSDEDFHHPLARASFGIIRAMRARSEDVDFRVLLTELKNMGHDDADLSLTEAGKMPSLLSVGSHVKRIRDLANRRRITDALVLAADMTGDHAPIPEVTAYAIAALRDIGDPYEHRVVELKHDALDLASIQARRKITTGFVDLDRILTGLYGGQFIVCGSRPRMGKSAIALQIARHAGETCPVLYFSLEMVKSSLYLRMLSSDTGIPVTQIRDGNIGDADKRAIAERMERMKDITPYLTVVDHVTALSKIESIIVRTVKKYEFCLVVVDYLQLVTVSKRNVNRYVDIGDVSRTFKRIANEHDIPVFAMAQLSRNAEGRMPTLGDIRESGDIEQDADVVMFLHRDYNEQKTKLKDEAVLLVAKNRDGDTGVVDLQFIPSRVMFGSVEKRYEVYGGKYD